MNASATTLRFVDATKSDYLLADAFFIFNSRRQGDLITLSTTQEETEEDATAGVCKAGDVLRPGESCTYLCTEIDFSVLANGSGHFLFFTVGTGMHINSVINGRHYTFVAHKLDSGSWQIDEVGASDNQQSTTSQQAENTEDTQTTASAFVHIASTTIVDT